VVADEVRQLAGRTSKSTSEIEEVVKTNEGLTSRVTEYMGKVKTNTEINNGQISQVSSIITEIHGGALNVSKTVSALL
jgi:methyl-accepting chemotaxis protein